MKISSEAELAQLDSEPLLRDGWQLHEMLHAIGADDAAVVDPGVAELAPLSNVGLVHGRAPALRVMDFLAILYRGPRDIPVPPNESKIASEAVGNRDGSFRNCQFVMRRAVMDAPDFEPIGEVKLFGP